jgi:hypothetical protein
MPNTSEITGNANIVIQGCNLSQISVNQIDLQKFEQSLRNIIHTQTKPLHLLIITTSTKSIENEVKGIDFSLLKTHYDEKHENWKPYSKEDTILKLLKDYQDKSGYRLNAFILDFKNEEIDNIFIDSLKNMKKNLVLLVDSFALHFAGNEALAKVFNDKEIGGCLIPICQTHTTAHKEIMFKRNQKIFSSLYNFHYKYADVFLQQRQDSGYFYIDLEVTDRNTFFRRLTSIARLQFDLTCAIPALQDQFEEEIPLTLNN